MSALYSCGNHDFIPAEGCLMCLLSEKSKELEQAKAELTNWKIRQEGDYAAYLDAMERANKAEVEVSRLKGVIGGINEMISREGEDSRKAFEKLTAERDAATKALAEDRHDREIEGQAVVAGQRIAKEAIKDLEAKLAEAEKDKARMKEAVRRKMEGLRHLFMSIRTMTLTDPDHARTMMICIEASDGANALSDVNIDAVLSEPSTEPKPCHCEVCCTHQKPYCKTDQWKCGECMDVGAIPETDMSAMRPCPKCQKPAPEDK